MQDLPRQLPPDAAKWTVGRILRFRREALDLPQDAVAQHLGLSASFISLLEAGKKFLPEEVLLDSLCERLGLDEPEDRDLVFEKHRIEAAAALATRMKPLGGADDFVPGVPTAALRVLLESDPTARAAVEAWIRRMRVTSERVKAVRGRTSGKTRVERK